MSLKVLRSFDPTTDPFEVEVEAVEDVPVDAEGTLFTLAKRNPEAPPKTTKIRKTASILGGNETLGESSSGFIIFCSLIYHNILKKVIDNQRLTSKNENDTNFEMKIVTE